MKHFLLNLIGPAGAFCLFYWLLCVGVILFKNGYLDEPEISCEECGEYEPGKCRECRL